jgi:hypothetical protein
LTDDAEKAVGTLMGDMKVAMEQQVCKQCRRFRAVEVEESQILV